MIEPWDEITYAEARAIVNREASWLRQRAASGKLSRVGRTSDVRLSRLEVEALALARWKANRHQQGGYWCTVTEAAAILRCTHGLIYKLVKKDKLPALPTGSGHRLFRRTQVEVIANARRVRWHNEPVKRARGYDRIEGY